MLSLKLDGLSVILTYQNGFLVKALTRGNGEIGEVITNNAKTFKNIPAKIPYTGTLVIRGEALIRYSDFKFKYYNKMDYYYCRNSGDFDFWNLGKWIFRNKFYIFSVLRQRDYRGIAISTNRKKKLIISI